MPLGRPALTTSTLCMVRRSPSTFVIVADEVLAAEFVIATVLLLVLTLYTVPRTSSSSTSSGFERLSMRLTSKPLRPQTLATESQPYRVSSCRKGTLETQGRVGPVWCIRTWTHEAGPTLS